MSDNTTAIDQAINAAKARKNLKQQASGQAPSEDGSAGNTGTAKEPRKPKFSPEEKAAMQASRDADRAARKAINEAKRAAKAEAKAALKAATPHMGKVQKAASRLAPLDERAQLTFNEITASFTAAQVGALAEHLQHFNRIKATERALQTRPNVGDEVLIVSGDSRFTGKTGVVSIVQRIRCYVDVEGFKKPAYLFTSDVEVTKAAETPAVIDASQADAATGT